MIYILVLVGAYQESEKTDRTKIIEATIEKKLLDFPKPRRFLLNETSSDLVPQLTSNSTYEHEIENA